MWEESLDMYDAFHKYLMHDIYDAILKEKPEPKSLRFVSKQEGPGVCHDEYLFKYIWSDYTERYLNISVPKWRLEYDYEVRDYLYSQLRARGFDDCVILECLREIYCEDLSAARVAKWIDKSKENNPVAVEVAYEALDKCGITTQQFMDSLQKLNTSLTVTDKRTDISVKEEVPEPVVLVYQSKPIGRYGTVLELYGTNPEYVNYIEKKIDEYVEGVKENKNEVFDTANKVEKLMNTGLSVADVRALYGIKEGE